jgi:hypothetical protein
MKPKGIQLSEFREELHEFFPYRADAIMDLIDALACNGSAKSPVELSLNSQFQRQYGSIYKAIDKFFISSDPQKGELEHGEHQQMLMRIVSKQCPEPVQRNFRLFGLDATGQPRPFAHTLMDRGIHYHPNPAPGNKPVMVGHSYSVLTALPEKKGRTSPPWVIPLLIRRVPTDKKATEVGSAQIADLLKEETLPFGKDLSVLVGDSAYSARGFLDKGVEHKNLVIIVRVRGNRTFYRMPGQDDSSSVKGHPVWYGKPFDMKDPPAWDDPDAKEVVSLTLRNGRVCQVEIEAWLNLLMRGQRDIPMHEHPFTLIRIRVKDSNGKAVFKQPLWLIIIGDHRQEISLSDAYKAYRQRYDLEHFFRFGKRRLLMVSCQTPNVEREENWLEIVGLAYVQLYIGAPLAQNLPRPWERYLPQVKESKSEEVPSPSMVQRDMPRIIKEIGSPSSLPKLRGKSPGRAKGYSPGKRERFPIVFKGNKSGQKQIRAP